MTEAEKTEARLAALERQAENLAAASEAVLQMAQAMVPALTRLASAISALDWSRYGPDRQ